ncbi:MAG: VCBS repeat-containing protein, partial [Planctomycetes bacterium]|nr:VCBS repeat-containing protein [Planctomycetota bacterium]
GDVNGDGRADLFLGGAAGQSGQLLLSQGGGRFEASRSIAAIEKDKAPEDMGVLLFDVDADGDNDLYVVSGGVECEKGDRLLRDRLDLNDGQGKFTPAPHGAIPESFDSGSVVCAADFDRDGDLDLFVGGRVVPGEYPTTPNSRLLINDGGRFADRTAALAPQLLRSGMVTGALWSDADGDGWVDLLVTHEYGPVKLYRNERGKLVDKTEHAGLSTRLGWWNAIAARDVDGDGDVSSPIRTFTFAEPIAAADFALLPDDGGDATREEFRFANAATGGVDGITAQYVRWDVTSSMAPPK